MRSALYYPFTRPNSESFLKTSLFLWDTVDFIVPYSEFFGFSGDLNTEQEAMEIVERPYVPTEKASQHCYKCVNPLFEKYSKTLEKRARSP